MFKAFGRYFSYPKVSQVTMQSISTTPLPLIFFCAPDQFDFVAASEMGYQGQIFYLAGKRKYALIIY